MRPVIVALMLVLALSACGDGGSESDGSDPYEVYLENAPSGEPTLSREDAQLRATLGCGMEFAPGTVDAILREAYDPECPEE